MRYKPENKDPITLLKNLGFVSANRGYVLNRSITRVKKSSPVRIHALVLLDGTIDMHEDYDTGNKKEHLSIKFSPRLERFKEIMQCEDAGIPLDLSPKMKKNYCWPSHIRGVDLSRKNLTKLLSPRLVG